MSRCFLLPGRLPAEWASLKWDLLGSVTNKPAGGCPMIRLLFASVLLAFALAAAGPTHVASASNSAVLVAAAQVRMFDTETAAQAHCPRDVVVWLNIPTGIYHEKGMRWYGRTKHGAYVCRKEADAAGDRDTRNGQ